MGESESGQTLLTFDKDQFDSLRAFWAECGINVGKVELKNGIIRLPVDCQSTWPVGESQRPLKLLQSTAALFFPITPQAEPFGPSDKIV